jgi:tetratricopeptide (TPR) repeat protein
LPEIDGAWNLSHRKGLMCAVTLFLLTAAILCDAPTACCVPVAMYLIAWWKFADARTTVAPLVLALTLTTFIAWEQRTQWPPGVAATPAQIVPIAGRGVLFHIGKLALPYPLLLAYSRWTVTAMAWIFPVAVIATVGVLIAMRARLGRGTVAAGLAFLALVLPPVVLHDPHGAGFVADAQQYLARAAVLIAIAAAVAPLIPEFDPENNRHRFTGPLIGAAVALLLVGLTWNQAEKCKSSEVAWANVIAHDPSSRIARTELGVMRLGAGDVRGAAEQFERLAAADPSDADAQIRVGEALLQQNRPADAVAYLERAATLRPRDPAPLRALANVDKHRGDLASAAERYRKALAIEPHDDVSRNNLATLYARQGDRERALAEYQRALAENPHATQIHLNLASLLFSMGRLDDAAAHLHEAVNIDPGDPKAYVTSGAILMQFKDYPNAARMFRAAIRLNRDSYEAFNLLGVALVAQGNTAEAIYNFGRAIDLKPDYAPAKQNLAAAQRQRDGVAATSPATTRPAR